MEKKKSVLVNKENSGINITRKMER